MTPWLGAALAALLAGAAYLLGWLTRSGAAAAVVVGSVVFVGAGLPGAVLLALFFVTASVLTRGSSGRARIDRPAGGRTARQVVANGGWAAAGAALLATGVTAGWAILAGSLAAAQADTWATEIGVRSTSPPRMLTTGQPVPPGTSGAITPLGTAAGVAGAIVMAGTCWALGLGTRASIAVLVAGMGGVGVDSVLGATLQASYRCDRCNVTTERPAHHCGARARLVRGWAWLDNDAVNLAASGAGAACALLLGAL